MHIQHAFIRVYCTLDGKFLHAILVHAFLVEHHAIDLCQLKTSDNEEWDCGKALRCSYLRSDM